METGAGKRHGPDLINLPYQVEVIVVNKCRTCCCVSIVISYPCVITIRVIDG